MTGIIRVFVVLSIAAGTVGLVSSCLFPATTLAAERHVLWQSREQFVALEPREGNATDPSQQNGHPATLTLNQLTTLLAALQFSPGESTAAEPLFSVQALETLTPQLVLGLQKATQGEDLTFAVIGLHKALLGLAKEPRVTTGRLFIKDGKLNLIVGLAQRDVNEREDRRLVPFTPGSRLTAATGEWLLQAPAHPPGYTLACRDWVTVAINWQPLPPADTSPKTLSNQAPAALNRREPPRSPAERLTTLNELKDNGLITDEEYRTKRQQILNEL